ncbi:MAG: DUF2065 family protein [Pseudomonadales bacterium]|nr:DUF2065 family protein [Pseudomonadales bacterium]
MTLDHLWIALCLVLVIEGLMPFASPKALKAMVMQAQGLDERLLRIYGLVLMVLGTLMLYWLNG